MTTINDLTEQLAVVSSDQFPIFSTVNGQSRKVSAAALAVYVESTLDDVLEPVKLASYTIAQLPDAATNAYSVVYCLNGNAGAACLAVSNGTAWKVVALGATAS